MGIKYFSKGFKGILIFFMLGLIGISLTACKENSSHIDSALSIEEVANLDPSGVLSIHFNPGEIPNDIEISDKNTIEEILKLLVSIQINNGKPYEFTGTGSLGFYINIISENDSECHLYITNTNQIIIATKDNVSSKSAELLRYDIVNSNRKDIVDKLNQYMEG